MGGTRQTLSLPQIVEINRSLIREFGGVFFEADDNLANRGSLELVLEEINAIIFGQELHPTIHEKAALLAWRIIRNHIFHDGNKRTGMETCRLFLDVNGFHLRIDAEVVDMAVQVATNDVTFEAFVAWVEQRCTLT